MDGLKHIPWVTPVAGVKHLSVKEVKPYTSEYQYATLLNVSISTYVPVVIIMPNITAAVKEFIHYNGKFLNRENSWN